MGKGYMNYSLQGRKENKMKTVDSDTLKKMLKQKLPGGAYVLYGDEDYLKNLSASRIIDAFVEPAARSFDFSEFFEEIDVAELRDLSMALPMLSEKRVILLRDPDIFDMREEQAQSLALLIKELPDECVLIFSFVTKELSFAKSKTYSDKKAERAKSVFADATAVQCNKLSLTKAEKWVAGMLSEREKRISPEAARKLVELCGNDMYSIRNNTSILAASDAEEITEDMLSFVTYTTLEEDSFRLADAISGGDYTRAYDLLDELIKKKADPRELMPTVLSNFVALYRVAVALEEKGDYRSLEGNFGYKPYAFQLKKARGDLRGRSTEYFRRAILLCAEAERKLKLKFAGYEAYYDLIGGLVALDEERL